MFSIQSGPHFVDVATHLIDLPVPTSIRILSSPTAALENPVHLPVSCINDVIDVNGSLQFNNEDSSKDSGKDGKGDKGGDKDSGEDGKGSNEGGDKDSNKDSNKDNNEGNDKGEYPCSF